MHKRENLIKLMNKLRSLPDNYKHFHMNDYFANESGDLRFNEKRRNYLFHNGGVGECGAVACAVGHGPSAGVFFTDDLFEIGENESLIPNWNLYALRNFVPREGEDDEHEARWINNNNVYHWLFSGGWWDHDDTPQGAAARIQYYLERGLPEGFTYVSWVKDFVHIYQEYVK